MHVRNLQFWIGLTALAVIATGCGGDDPRPKRLESAKIERFLTEDASTRLEVAVDVTCPDTIIAGKGKRFTCQATATGSTPIPLEATQQDAKGNLTWRMDARSTPAIEQEIEAGILDQKQLRVSVECPDLFAFEQGDTFVCTATAKGGKRTQVVVTQVDDEGGINWTA